MGVQAKILSFDEAKKTDSKKRPSHAAQNTVTRKPVKRNSSKLGSSSPKKTSVSLGDGKKKQFEKQTVSHPSRRQVSPRPSVQQNTQRKPSVKRGSVARETAKNKKSTSSTSSTAKATKRTAGQKSIDNRHSKVQDNKKEPTKSSAKISKFSEAKRSHNKNKADKEFTKRFGDTSSSASEGSPRAAVYKGQMGRQHKKASKMQNSASAGFFARFSMRGGFRSSPVFVTIIMLVIGIAISGAFLYSPAKQYYLTVREHDQMVAEYEAIQERNNKIQSQVDSLSTPEGVEDRVRSEYGWVKNGENAVQVKGLDIEEEGSSFTEGIPAGSVEAPETWYSSILDTLFGV